jgi:MoaA/NifB/PqqE/SkfB family radical SAM enzyme
MAEAGVNELVLSVHGVRHETYEYFMQGARHDRLMEVLQTFKELRSGHRGRFPQIRINYTVNPDNLSELKEFFEVFDGYGVDTLQVRPIMDIGGEYKESIGDNLIDEYKEIIGFLSQGCSERGIRLLANTSDAGYQQKNRDAALAELVYAYISPKTAGKLGLDWKSTNHRQYKKADHWHRDLWQIVGGRMESGGWMDRSLKYDQM